MSFITESKKVYQQVKLNELNATKDGKHFSVNYRKKDEPESMKYKKVFTDKQRALDFEKEIKSQGHIVEQITEESDDHEVSMARGELEGIADKALKLSSLLKSKSDSGNPIEAWVQSKITKAAEMVNSVHDYMVYNPDVNEELKEAQKVIGGGLISQAKAIAKKFADNYTKAYNEIEKLQKGLTQNDEVQRALRQYNEEVELDEIKISDIHKMQQDGKSAEDIAKELNLSPVFVKRILGEDREWSTQSNAKLVIESMTDLQIAQLKKEFDPLKNRQISTARANQLSNILDKLDDGTLQKLRDALIPFVSAVSAAKLTTRKFRGVKITNVKVPGLENMAEDTANPGDAVVNMAKRLGLDNYGYARYGKDNVVTHRQFGGTLQKLDKSFKLDKPLKKEEVKEDTFKNNIVKKIVKPISDYLAQKEKEKQPVKEETSNWWHDGKSGYVKASDSDKDLIAWLKKNGYKPEKKEEAELKSVPSLEDSAKKHKVDIEVLKKQLEKGIEIEKEHTNDEKTAEKIALAHIDERPDYYIQIDKLEKKPVEKVSEAMFDVRLDVDGSVSEREAQTVSKMLSGKGIQAKVEPSERDRTAVTINTSKSKEEVVKALGNIVDESNRAVNEGVYKDIDVRKGDLKIAKDKRQALKDKYNAIMAGQASGDEHALGDQIRKLDMSIKKQEQELIDIMKKTGTLKKNEEKRLYVESLSALKDKAEKSGMPYNILKQVYDRGMAAWKSGHRPGAGQHQWALARVNSFVTKSSGTWDGADKDLAKKVKGD